MIEFKPNIQGETVEYTAVENGKTTGHITLTYHLTACAVLQIEADNDETAEGLIRSALNAAANRGAYTAVYEPEAFRNIAMILGFEQNGEKLTGEIPFLLTGSCCKASKFGK